MCDDNNGYMIKTTKGKDCFINGDHVFFFEREMEEKKIWKCSEYYKLNCKARIHSINGTIIKSVGVHCHYKDINSLECRNVLNKIKKRAIAEDTGTGVLICEESVGVSDSLAAKLPPIRSLKRYIRRIRQPVLPQAIIEPKSRSELEIPSEFITT